METPDDNALDALVARCIALHRSVEDHGSNEVRAAYRVLLLELGRQLARRFPPPNGMA